MIFEFIVPYDSKTCNKMDLFPLSILFTVKSQMKRVFNTSVFKCHEIQNFQKHLSILFEGMKKCNFFTTLFLFFYFLKRKKDQRIQLILYKSYFFFTPS